MFSRVPELYMHTVRWILTIGWIVLIISLFYDPVSTFLTMAGATFGPAEPNACAEFQGSCIPIAPYPMGARIFWGIVLPLVVITLIVFGHEAWRRMCPLSFISQIPRALGWQRNRVIAEDSWLGRNYLYFQFGLLFLGLNIRLLFANSDRLLLGIFLLLTLIAALAVGFLYAGKTWCQYFCPMAPVQMIYSEPSGLMGSKAHIAPSRTITQSMCRTVDQTGQEKSACVACKSSCMDIDAEHAYWESINRTDHKWLYYGYVGLAIGFYLYFGLYSGNWSFLSGGVWNETNQLETLFNPGFYIAGHALPIPKLVAVPLTLAGFSGATYLIGRWIERRYIRYSKRIKTFQTIEHIHHQLFAIATFIAFNCLFFLGVHPTLGWLPEWMQPIVSWFAVLVSSLWLAKTWRLSAAKYARERDGNFLRRQLTKLNIDLSPFLEGRALNELNADELYALAKVLPGFSRQHRLQLYKGVLKEALERHSVQASNSLRNFKKLRQELEIHDTEHVTILDQVLRTHPELIHPRRCGLSDTEQTVRRSHVINSAERTISSIVQPSIPQDARGHNFEVSESETDSKSRLILGQPSFAVDPTVVRPSAQEPNNLNPTVVRASILDSGNLDPTIAQRLTQKPGNLDSTVIRPSSHQSENSSQLPN